MVQSGRQNTAGTGYRYGFNGKENDNEVKGDGNQQDYGMRIYDPRLGRFLSVDPLNTKFPFYTPYSFAGNKPIWAFDLDGLEECSYGQRLENQWIPALMSGKMTEEQYIRNLNATAIGGGIGALVAVEVGVTKGWITNTIILSQVLGAFEHNRASTPEGRAAQDLRSKEALTNAAITYAFGKIFGVGLKVAGNSIRYARNRFKTANNFYTRAGYSEEKFVKHARGIDLNEKVFETTFKKGTELEQWAIKNPQTGEIKMGDYYTLPGQDPSKLGISLENRIKISVTLSEDTKFLQSTASDIKDWNGTGITFQGGGTQLFQTNVKYTVQGTSVLKPANVK